MVLFVVWVTMQVELRKPLRLLPARGVASHDCDGNSGIATIVVYGDDNCIRRIALAITLRPPAAGEYNLIAGDCTGAMARTAIVNMTPACYEGGGHVGTATLKSKLKGAKICLPRRPTKNHQNPIVH